MLLVHRHLDSGTHDLILRATVKVALASEQTREQERVPEIKIRRQRTIRSRARWPSKALAWLALRATPLKERITVVDTVPKATHTPPRVPIRARASESLLLSCAREKTACCTCV